MTEIQTELKPSFTFKQYDEEEQKYVQVNDPKDLLSTATVVDFTGVSDERLFSAVKEAVGESQGYGAVNSYGRAFPLHALARIKQSLEDSFENWDLPQELYLRLFEYLDKFVVEKTRQLKINLDRGLLEFEDVQFIFEKGTAVVAEHEGELVGGFVDSTNRIVSLYGTYYEVKIRVIYALGSKPQEGTLKAHIMAYGGLRQLSTLSVRFATEEDKAALALRGKIFERVTSSSTYLQYDGQITRTTWSSQKSYRSTGRVMVDAGSFAQVDNTQFTSETYVCGIEEARRSNHATQERTRGEVSEHDLWRCMPFVYGFSFASKQWGRLDVTKLTPIEWRDDAWNKLVLEPELKELVRALVDNHGGNFEDIIEGKGGGTIFLLHGPPGQGKTLTAETIAERLHRPLYSVSVGELGVDPDELESRLRVILDIATTWNAVILIDEADIFLEERDEHNIVRNAMVGVFLRLLEYHQGVLFLTTNRVKTIDEAFYSRISVAIYFRDEGEAKRQKVWTNLLDAAKIEGLSPSTLAAHELNGRQIKNVIKQAQTLARDRNTAVSANIVEEVVNLTAKFRADLLELKAQKEEA